MILGAITSAILEMDHLGVTVGGSQVVYKFKTTALHPKLANIKSKILSLLDLPVDIPTKVELEEIKRGPIFKEYMVDITVPRRKSARFTKILGQKFQKKKHSKTKKGKKKKNKYGRKNIKRA